MIFVPGLVVCVVESDCDSLVRGRPTCSGVEVCEVVFWGFFGARPYDELSCDFEVAGGVCEGYGGVESYGGVEGDAGIEGSRAVDGEGAEEGVSVDAEVCPCGSGSEGEGFTCGEGGISVELCGGFQGDEPGGVCDGEGVRAVCFDEESFVEFGGFQDAECAGEGAGIGGAGGVEGLCGDGSGSGDGPCGGEAEGGACGVRGVGCGRGVEVEVSGEVCLAEGPVAGGPSDDEQGACCISEDGEGSVEVGGGSDREGGGGGVVCHDEFSGGEGVRDVEGFGGDVPGVCDGSGGDGGQGSGPLDVEASVDVEVAFEVCLAVELRVSVDDDVVFEVGIALRGEGRDGGGLGGEVAESGACGGGHEGVKDGDLPVDDGIAEGVDVEDAVAPDGQTP